MFCILDVTSANVKQLAQTPRQQCKKMAEVTGWKCLMFI